MLDRALTVDPRQAVRWAYTFLLGREPENEAIVDLHLAAEGGGAPDALRSRLIKSAEFLESVRGLVGPQEPVTDQIGPLDGFLAQQVAPTPGAFTDRFGVRTRVAYLPASYAVYSGQVGSPDGRYDMPLHEPAEVNALLRSVHGATGSFAAMELGAGWAPWIVLGATLAARRNLPATVAGVEGSGEHVAFMHTHMDDNGIDPATRQIIHAVVGAEDGIARFPKLPDPSADWGAQADFNADKPAETEWEEVTCLSLKTLLGRMPVLDFLHCDVQGAEADVFEAAIEDADQRVRRTCIGTHSRAVEERLLHLLSAHGWVLEEEHPCRFVQNGTTMALVADGVQVWRNPRLM